MFAGFLFQSMQPARLPLPTGLDVGPVNVYLFTDPEPILVDAGIRSAESWEALQVALAEHGLRVLDISRVIITHAHVDHYGQAGTIAAHSDADVWISDLGAPWLLATADLWERRLVFYEEYFLPGTGLSPEIQQLVLSGLRYLGEQSDPIPPERIHTFRLDGTLQMGGLPWQVVHTPGHASMQTCFYQAEIRRLLSADMLLATTPTPIVESPADFSTARTPALPQFLDSLARVAALDVELVLPGHGRPFFDHRQVVERQRRRIFRRRDECLELIKTGHRTMADLLDQMYAHRAPVYRVAGLWMLTGYLDLLEAAGMAGKETIDGVWFYYPREP